MAFAGVPGQPGLFGGPGSIAFAALLPRVHRLRVPHSILVFLFRLSNRFARGPTGRFAAVAFFTRGAMDYNHAD